MASHVYTIDCHRASLTLRLCRPCKPDSRIWPKKRQSRATKTGGDASRIAMRSTVCSQIPRKMQIALSHTLCGTLQQESADADALYNCFYSQSGVIWKDQVMRADPLESTLGIMRASSLPRSYAPFPPLGCGRLHCLPYIVHDGLVPRSRQHRGRKGPCLDI